MDAVIGVIGLGFLLIGFPISVIILILKLIRKKAETKDKTAPIIVFVGGAALFSCGLSLSGININAEELATNFSLLIIIAIIVFWAIYENRYYKSEDFKQLKDSVASYVQDCNELNIHINELRNVHVGYNQLNYGKSNYYDDSKRKYKRKELSNIKRAPNIYNCSRQVCDGSRKQPYKYICKYFGIKLTEESVEMFEHMLNNFEAANNGKIALMKEKNRILNTIQYKIPFIIKTLSKKRLEREIGFKSIQLNKTDYPKYIFQYVSSGGYSSLKNEITLDISELNGFIKYLSEVVTFKKSAAGQRALMTSALRKKILMRDGYTCKICGASIKQEPNLLLEIDHIFPISKGGMTTESNLRTLCWKCNRKKGNKVEGTIKENDSNVIYEIPKTINNPYSFKATQEKNDIQDLHYVSIEEVKETENKKIQITERKTEFIEFEEGANNMYDRNNGIYPAGQYLVGEDIEKGKYLLTSRDDCQAMVTLYESYNKFKKDEMIIYHSFKGDYHLSLREDGIFIDVDNADIKKI